VTNGFQITQGEIRVVQLALIEAILDQLMDQLIELFVIHRVVGTGFGFHSIGEHEQGGFA